VYFITFVVVYILLTAGLGVWVADKKGYSTISWFFMCLITGIAGPIAIYPQSPSGRLKAKRKLTCRRRCSCEKNAKRKTMPEEEYVRVAAQLLSKGLGK